MKFGSLFLGLFLTIPALSQEGGGGGSVVGGLFLEPGIFYEVGTAQFTTENRVIDFSGKLEGFGVGAKGGFHVWDVGFAGLDFMYSQPKFTDNEGRFSSNTKSWLLGFVAGAQMPLVGLRVWAGYLPFGQMEQDKDRGLAMKFTNPGLFKLGAGFRLVAISLNLEYMWGSYGRSEVTNDGTNFASFPDASAKRNMWLLGVTFPLAF